MESVILTSHTLAYLEEFFLQYHCHHCVCHNLSKDAVVDVTVS